MLLLLVACAADVDAVDSHPPRDRRDDSGRDSGLDSDGDSRPPVESLPGTRDTGPDDPEDVPGDSSVPDTPDDPTDAVFQLETMHTAELTISEEGQASLAADPFTYVVADLDFDGQSYPGVGVRIKGRLGSYRSLDSKAALKVDFNAFGGTDELAGMGKLNFNNMVQDCSKVHELAAYGVHRLAGVPAPRVAYLWLKINGVDFGVYSLVEEMDHEFLERHYADPTGNLYDGDYYMWPDWSYTLVDFTKGAQGYFQLDEGVDVGLADIQAVTSAVTASVGKPAFQTVVGGLVDLDEFAAFYAASAWTGHSDSYVYYSNNYRVYFNPETGKAELFPWDPDWAFYESTAVGSPYGILATACRLDDTCHQAVLDAASAIQAAVAGSEVEAEVLAAEALINDRLIEDATQPGFGSILGCQIDLESWFADREAALGGL